MYAKGKFSNFYLDIFDNHFLFFFWVLMIPFWRDTHFFIIHRMMHPYNTKYFPDIGRWLYKNAHYLHHLSHNITPWSGIAMHPIESFFYESAIIVPCFFKHHPIFMNIIKIDLTLSAVLGHDGHDFPGAGNFYHYLHHTKINVNFGTPNSPFDYFFGSLDRGEDEIMNC